MGRRMLGSLTAMALALVLASSAQALGSTQAAAQTWQVSIGAQSDGGALQAQAFGPSNLTINEGDTVTWTLDAFVHTVTFLSGTPRPPDAVPGEGGEVLFNPAVAFPVGGPTYDGSGYVNSGILAEHGATFSLTFTKAGDYTYLCVLHPGMAARVLVQPAGSAYPMTQQQLDAQGDQELSAKLAHAKQLQQGAQVSSSPGQGGTTSYKVHNGVGGNQATVLRFLPTDLTVKAGDSVTWTVNDPHEIHTVSFFDVDGKVPPFLVPQPQASGPPKLVIPHAAPEGGTVVDSRGFYNSGIMAPGQSYSFSFPKPGVYTYVCLLHPAEGMFGTVTVEAVAQLPLPETGVVPIALPATSAAQPPRALGLLIVALGVLFSGALLRWRHKQQLG